jgi:hypothetical protein
MRFAQATSLTVISCWVSIEPTPALAQDRGSLVVTITSPASGSTVAGSIAVNANTTIIGSLIVAGVQFNLDGVALGAEDTSAPYAVLWDTRTSGNTSHVLTAVARDSFGLRWTSEPVTVTVSNTSSDTTPPTVSVTSPLSGSTVTGIITVTADAADNVGVSGVQFTLDGANLDVEVTSAPYSVSWNTSAAGNGSHALAAIARDAAGNRTTSVAVAVTVSNDASVCATPLDAFPGSTAFNNTTRAQMWFVNNTWWGAFSDASTGIYFYKLQGSTFVKGDFIDANFSAGKPDTLWNGTELFVVVQQSGSLATLYKYSYLAASGSFALISGFPINLQLAGLATVVSLYQDSTGKVWATYPSGSNVYVIWSTSADHRTWNTTGFVLAPDVSNWTTEASAIMHFGGDKIGVAWGNQSLAEYAFRFHHDGDPETVWSPKEVVDCCSSAGSVADDHLSLRAAPDGRLFLVAKDSIGNGNLHFYVRGVNGPWGEKTMVDTDSVAQPTRPMLALDVEADLAFVIYHNSTEKRVYVARTGMNSPGFGPRCLFMNQGNNVTSTKQNVNASTGLVAADSSNTGQILPGRVSVGSAATSVAPASTTFVSASDETTTTTTGPATATTQPATSALNGTPIAGFEFIWPGRLSTSQTAADAGQWWWLRAQGVHTIVNLDATNYDFVQYGFDSFLWIPVGPGEMPSDAQASSFLKFIQLCDNEPAHLSGGVKEGRATLVALLRYAVDAWTIADALAEGQRINGGDPLSPEQVTWLQRWAATHAPGSERLNACLGQ